MVAPVEVGEGGVDLLVRNGVLKEHETRDRKAVGEACLAALEVWATGRGARITEQGLGPLAGPGQNQRASNPMSGGGNL